MMKRGDKVHFQYGYAWYRGVIVDVRNDGYRHDGYPLPTPYLIRSNAFNLAPRFVWRCTEDVIAR